MSGLSLCDLCLCYSILGSQFSNKYLLTYTAIGTINMTGYTLTKLSNSIFDHDVPNKLYVDDKTRDSQRDCV